MKQIIINSIQSLLHKFDCCLKGYKVERQAVINAKEYFGNKEIIACEIGTFGGEHAYQMLKHLNIKKLYLIDPYEEYGDYEKDGSCNRVFKAKLKAHKLLEPFKDKIVWIEKYSDDAIKDIKEQIDFLYIDGNHFSPYVDNDIKNYYPLVKDKGIISGHDYWGNAFKDVTNAVHNFIKKENKDLTFGYGGDWVVVK